MTQDVNEVLTERKKTHGEYTEHATVTQALMRVMMATPNWEKLPDIVKETLHMEAHKNGRILTGNWSLADHYVDKMGYNKLILERTLDGQGLKPEHDPEHADYSYVRLPGANLKMYRVGEVVNVNIQGASLAVVEAALKEMRPGTPEDGGHHARQADPSDESQESKDRDDLVLPSSLREKPNIPPKEQTFAQLLEELTYWERKLQSSSGPASAGACQEFGRAILLEIGKRGCEVIRDAETNKPIRVKYLEDTRMVPRAG